MKRQAAGAPPTDGAKLFTLRDGDQWKFKGFRVALPKGSANVTLAIISDSGDEPWLEASEMPEDGTLKMVGTRKRGA